MIVDCILDRKDGKRYDPYDFYHSMLMYGNGEVDSFGSLISYCMDYFGESMVRKALCEYIDGNDYNPSIKDYINSVNWLIAD